MDTQRFLLNCLKDENTKSIQINNYITSIKDHLRGKPYSQHVCEIIPVSNLNVVDKGIQHLRQKIMEVAKQQPHWGEDRPVKWLLLADELAERAHHLEEKKMMLQELQQIAKKSGIPEEELEVFLTFHHNLGDIIYFDEAETQDTIILSPQWLASVFRY